MNTRHLILAVWPLMFVCLQANASDNDLCKAGYPDMLMTDLECQAYLDKRSALMRAGNQIGLQMLEAGMKIELQMRAVACFCSPEKPIKVSLSKNDGC